mgnify:CR=1 FL=1
MRQPPAIVDEDARLRSFAQYEFGWGRSEPDLDAIVQLAARMFDVPIAVVNMVDHDHVVFVAAVGADGCAMDREVSVCAHAITGQETMIVHDAAIDPRFCDNPLVTGPSHFRFYAGVPLVNPSGHRRLGASDGVRPDRTMAGRRAV